MKFFCIYGYDSEIHIDNCNIVIFDLAGDLVLLNLLKIPTKHRKFNFEVLLRGISSIDGGEKLNTFIKENNCTIAYLLFRLKNKFFHYSRT